MNTKTVKVAVVTGGHAYDVVNFHALFRSLSGIDSYIQHIDDFAAASQVMRDSYDVILFYIMMIDGPSDDLPGFQGRPKSALEHLAQTDQGIVIVHHALLAYPQWLVWNKLVGIEDRSLHGYEHDETLGIQVVNPAHPITHNLTNWTMVDETYDMADAGPDSQILLTVAHANSMKTVAWTRQVEAHRVFCLQSGHDNQAWANENFKVVLHRGILWSINRL